MSATTPVLEKINQLPYKPVPDSTDLVPMQQSDGIVVATRASAIGGGGSPIDPANVMLKSEFNTNNTAGVVNDSENLNGQSASYYLNLSNPALTGQLTEAQITNLVADLLACEKTANKGATNGYTPLVGGVVPNIYLSFVATSYKGLYNATTNSPAIVNGTGTAGDFYIASVTGNAYAPVNVTVANQIVVYNGAIWQVGAVAAASVSSVNALTGAVVLTSANVPDSTNKRYISDTILTALNAANTPSAANPVATKADIINASVTNEWLSPEQFADTQTIGDGTLRLLGALNDPLTGIPYTLARAHTLWGNEVALDWSIDCAVWNKAFRTMENATGSQTIDCHGGRVYMWNKTVQMFTVSARSPIYKRMNGVEIAGRNCLLYNATGSPLKMLQRMPADQGSLVGNSYGSYKFYIHDLNFEGNGALGGVVPNTYNCDDIAIELGATYGSVFDRCSFRHFSKGLKIFFGLKTTVRDCDFGDCNTYGLLLSDASADFLGSTPLWTNTSVALSGCNASRVENTLFRCNDASFAGFIAQGSDGIYGDNIIYEGAGAPQHHFFWDGRASGVNRTVTMNKLHIEQDVLCSSICFRETGGTNVRAIVDTAFVQNLDSAQRRALIESRTGNSAGVMQITSSNIVNNESNWTMRRTGTGAHGLDCYATRLQNQNLPYNAINWDTKTIDDGSGDGALTGVVPTVGVNVYSQTY